MCKEHKNYFPQPSKQLSQGQEKEKGLVANDGTRDSAPSRD